MKSKIVVVITLISACAVIIFLSMNFQTTQDVAKRKTTGASASSGGMVDRRTMMRMSEADLGGDTKTDGSAHVELADGIDNMMDSWAAADLCDGDAVSKDVSARSLLEHYKTKHGPQDAVVLATEELIESVCHSRKTNVIISEPYKDRRDVLFQSSPLFQDVVAFSDILNNGAHKPVPSSEVEGFVVSAVQRASGRYELLETLTLLSNSRAIKIGLSKFYYPTHINPEVADYANIVAACRVFGGCGPYSAYSAQLCFLQCDHPMGAEEFARTAISPRDLVTFEQAINAILAARGS
ncbi:hypothetical protein [Dokdonella sp.]|uniref:hypothetical protein n=1 Tax=Dokdonella sp. TaxID=2291710 RepID=UPI0031BC62DB|nr:hypothetical protein [Dokdonella sp.]